MDTAKREKLGRYFKNSERFFWGLGPGNQDENYRWLEKKGFTFRKGAYAQVTEQLLQNPGVEELLRKVVIPRVKEIFTDAAIEYLRVCWRAGTRPDLALLKKYNINETRPFLEINTQFNFVERWGDFAGVWFEEIEEL